jgi:hypothetical protein
MALNTPSGLMGIISVPGRSLSPAAIDFIQALRESVNKHYLSIPVLGSDHE